MTVVSRWLRLVLQSAGCGVSLDETDAADELVGRALLSCCPCVSCRVGGTAISDARRSQRPPQPPAAWGSVFVDIKVRGRVEGRREKRRKVVGMDLNAHCDGPTQVAESGFLPPSTHSFHVHPPCPAQLARHKLTLFDHSSISTSPPSTGGSHTGLTDQTCAISTAMHTSV